MSQTNHKLTSLAISVRPVVELLWSNELSREARIAASLAGFSVWALLFPLILKLNQILHARSVPTVNGIATATYTQK